MWEQCVHPWWAMAVRGKYVHLIMSGGFVPWAVCPLQWAMAALGAVCPPQWAMAAPELERGKTREKKKRRKGRCVHLRWAMAAPGAVCPPQWAIAAPF